MTIPAHDAVDAEPGVPAAGVGHFALPQLAARTQVTANYFALMASVLTRRRIRVHGQFCPSARPVSSSLLTVASPR